MKTEKGKLSHTTALAPQGYAQNKHMSAIISPYVIFKYDNKVINI